MSPESPPDMRWCWAFSWAFDMGSAGEATVGEAFTAAATTGTAMLATGGWALADGAAMEVGEVGRGEGGGGEEKRVGDGERCWETSLLEDVGWKGQIISRTAKSKMSTPVRPAISSSSITQHPKAMQ